MKKRAIWLIAIVVVLVFALSVAGYATGGFRLATRIWLDGDGNVTTEEVEVPEFPEDTAPNDSAIELPDMDFE